MLRHLSSPSYKILKALLNLHNETAGPSTGLFWKAASLPDCWDDWLNSYFIHKSFLWTVVQPRPQSWQRDWSDPTCGPDRGSDPLSHMVLREGVVRPHRGPTSHKIVDHNLVKLSATFVTHVAHSLKSSNIFLISNTSIFHQKTFWYSSFQQHSVHDDYSFSTVTGLLSSSWKLNSLYKSPNSTFTF